MGDMRMPPSRRSRLAPTLLLTAAVVVAAPGALGLFVLGPKLVPSDGAGNDFFGISVAISGDRLVVGAQFDDDRGPDSGSAYVYERPAHGNWAQNQKVSASDGAADDYFGSASALDGDRMVIGAWGDDDRAPDAGSAYVFERSPSGTWTERQKLLPPLAAAGEYFGAALALSGDRLLVGASQYYGGVQTGSVYVYERGPGASGTWAMVQRLVGSDSADGDIFGWSVGLSGDHAVIGAWGDDDLGDRSGSAYVFERGPTGTWTERQKLLPGDGVDEDEFGNAVAIDGSRLVVGAYRKAGFAGAAYVYERGPTGTWTQQQKLTATDGASLDQFAWSLSVDGDRILAGAYTDDDRGPDAGSAYVFERSAGAWTQSQKILAPDGGFLDYFGWSVGLSADQLVVGAWRDDPRGAASGSAYVQYVNHPPTAVIADVPDAECSAGGADVALDGTGSFDPDGDALSFAWSAPGVVFDDPASAAPTGRFPLGTTAVTLVVTDTNGASGATTAAVRVADTIAPTLTLTRPAAGSAYVLDTEVSHGLGLPILAVGPLTIEAEAADQCGVVEVAFTSTAGDGDSDGAAPYTFLSDIAVVASGEVTVTATAFDLGGHAAGADVTSPRSAPGAELTAPPGRGPSLPPGPARPRCPR